MKKLFPALLALTAVALIVIGIGVLTIGVKRGIPVVLAGIALLLWALFTPLLRRKLPRLFKVAAATYITLCAVVFVVAVIASVQILTAYSDDKDIPRDAVVIVLGCGLNPNDNTTPSLMLARRLDAAIAYLNETPDAICIVSGGQGANELISEAQSMFDYMTARGIASERVIKEDKSTTTSENLAFSRDLMPHVTDNAVIVTDGFHEYRAHHIAKSLGLTPYTISSRAPFGLVAFFWLREIPGVILQTWF
ncbi:MAG: YdcF family protein [Oscillospiraceae bacterium]|nr:YdcF family protein [Oscillospiraceae bacterium]